MYKNIELPSAKSMISAAASVTATAMLVRSLSRDLIPQELSHYFFNKLNYFLTTFTNEITVIIDEYEGLNKNTLFQASELYLSTIITPSTKTFRASLPEKEKKILVSVGENEEITDKFNGVLLKWRLVQEKSQPRTVPYNDGFGSTVKSEVKYFVLTFHKKHKVKVVDEYLPYVLDKSKALKEEKKTIKLHTLNNDIVIVNGVRLNPWQSVNLDHPAKFDTLAMDDEMKNMIVDDLDRFVKRREFYRKVGKAWKRGYLLFGPPGTGKSSLIAAMANYLNFDVYDLELTGLRSNSDLRRLLISTANRSILVVEDIDASIDLSQRKKNVTKPPPQMYPRSYDQGPKVTLSGLLNFIDGLWSSCGDERIIIFTTNHKEKLDPALLRPGRMDVHIHMSYCTPRGFKMLVSNYLGISDHPLAMEAERLIASSKVTPAEIGEQLLKGEDPELVLRGLIEFIERKKESKVAEEEYVEVTKEEVVMEQIENGESSEGLKELVKMSNGSCSKVREKILKNGEAAKALRILVQLLEGETGTANAKDSVVNLRSSEVGIVSESGNEEGTKTE